MKFYQNQLKFIENDLVHLGATSSQLAWHDQHVSPTYESDPITKISHSHPRTKTLTKLT